MRIWSCPHYCYMAKYLKRSKKLQVLSYHGIHNTQVYIFQKTFPEMKLVSAVNICQLIPVRSSIMSRASRSRVPEFTRMHILEAAEGWQLLHAGWFTLEIEIVAPQWVSGEKMGGWSAPSFPSLGLSSWTANLLQFCWDWRQQSVTRCLYWDQELCLWRCWSSPDIWRTHKTW